VLLQSLLRGQTDIEAPLAFCKPIRRLSAPVGLQVGKRSGGDALGFPEIGHLRQASHFEVYNGSDAAKGACDGPPGWVLQVPRASSCAERGGPDSVNTLLAEGVGDVPRGDGFSDVYDRNLDGTHAERGSGDQCPTVRGRNGEPAREHSSTENVATACPESVGKLDPAENDRHVQSDLFEHAVIRLIPETPTNSIKDDLEEVMLQAQCAEFTKALNLAISNVFSEPKPFPGGTFLCNDSPPVLSSEGCLRKMSGWDPQKPWDMSPLLFTDSEVELLRNPGRRLMSIVFSFRPRQNRKFR